MDKSPKELIEEAEREDNEPRHAFDIVIPGEIRINQNLSWQEKHLYGLIRNLSRREGYCWATNNYLAKEMGISVPTVKRWIDHLVKEDALRREMINFKMYNRRRLWITGAFEKLKKSLISSSMNPPSVHPRSDDRLASEPQLKRDITEESLQEKYKGDAPLSPPPSKEKEEEKFLERQEHVKTTESEHKHLIEKFGPEKTGSLYKMLSDWKKDTSKNKWKKNDYRSILRWVDAAYEQKRAELAKLKEPWKKNPSHPKSTNYKDTSSVKDMLESPSPEFGSLQEMLKKSQNG